MNHSGKSSTLFALCGATVMASVFIASAPAFGQDQGAPSPSTAPDNTAKNQHRKITADQQTNAAGDRELTAQIRKAIIADRTLSLYAHNVKIITINGMVTLKGPVKSDSEKQTIAGLAIQATGSSDKITNNITVRQ